MDKEQLKQRTKQFAHRCVKLALSLPAGILGNHVKQQLVRCGTSVAANYRAVCVAQSKPTFVSKLAIVLEEADESCFWMEFIIDELMMAKKKVVPLLEEGEGISGYIFCVSEDGKKVSIWNAEQEIGNIQYTIGNRKRCHGIIM